MTLGYETSSASQDDAFAITRERLSGQVYQRLRHDLSVGKLTPGQKIKLRDVAANLKVSVTPVREALNRLIADGALEQVDGRSVVVPILTAETYLEISQVRAHLEGIAAVQAATVASRIDIEKVEAIHQRIVAANAANDLRGLIVENQNFHIEACRLGQMPTLLQIVENLWLKTGPVVSWLSRRPLLSRTPRRNPHVVMIKCLKAHDGEGARDAIVEDIMLNAKALAPFLNELKK